MGQCKVLFIACPSRTMQGCKPVSFPPRHGVVGPARNSHTGSCLVPLSALMKRFQENARQNTTCVLCMACSPSAAIHAHEQRDRQEKRSHCESASLVLGIIPYRRRATNRYVYSCSYIDARPERAVHTKCRYTLGTKHTPRLSRPPQPPTAHPHIAPKRVKYPAPIHRLHVKPSLPNPYTRRPVKNVLRPRHVTKVSSVARRKRDASKPD